MGRIGAIVEWTDISRPTKRDLLVVVAGFAAYFIAAVGVSALVSLVDTGVASHGTLAKAEGFDPVTLARTFALIWVFVALEEYTFRNLLQKLLYQWMDYKLAIGLTSVIFAGLHIPAYGGLATPSVELTFSLSLVFIGSVVLGYAYWRTGNVVVSTAIHGLINTVALAVAVL